MIRRQVGPEYWLVTQDDHARISGMLAQALGNGRFSPPSSASAILGIAMHDSGWPLHDEQPTLNAERQPRDVFESTRQIGLQVWTESAKRAAARDDYAGLLVSLHSLALSVFATAQAPIANNKWDLSDLRTRFELNQFQHGMIELQESLRQRLGLHTDRPLKYGLAEESLDPKEQRLTFDFRWLQAMDRLSLSICCTNPPFQSIDPVLPRIGAARVAIRVARPQADLLLLEPWPFAKDSMIVQAPFRRLPAERFTDEATFRAAYAAAKAEQFTVALRHNTI